MNIKQVYTGLIYVCLCILMAEWAEGASRNDKTASLIKHDRSVKFMIPPRLAGEAIPSPAESSAPSIILRSPVTNSPGNIIGSTYVAFQQSGGLGRKIALGYPQSEFTHMIWLYQQNPNFSPGYVGYFYQVYENGTYAHTVGGVQVTNQPFCIEGSLAILADNKAVIGSAPDIHESNAIAYIEYLANFGIFTGHFLTPDPVSEWYVDGMRTIYPVTEVHFGTDTVLYVLTSADTSDVMDSDWLYRVLYRKVGDGEFDNGRIIESQIGWAHTIVARQNTDSVAIVYIDYREDGPDRNPWFRGIVYRLSTDQGLTWGPQTNISSYTHDSLWGADLDLSALWDDNGDLHIVWNASRRYDDQYYYAYRCKLFHWSTVEQQTSVIADANYWAECFSNHFDMNAGKATISQCEDKLFVLWTQYNDEDIIDDCSEYGFANGELYMSASDDNGLTWDTAVNLTDTRTPKCQPGDCESDVFPSMPRYGAVYLDARDSLDIIYINDKDAGWVVEGQGAWTVNNVMHFRVPCRDVVHLPRISSDPVEYDYPMMIDTGQTADTSMILSNIGNGVLNWEATINYISGGEHDWLGVTPPTGYIDLAPLNIDSITVTLDSRNLPGNPSLWEAEIIISAVDHPGIVEPKTIPVSLVVISEELRPQEDTLETGCRSLIVYNTTRIGGQNSNYSLNIPGDCDTVDTYPDVEMYLYDASPIIAYINNIDDTIAYTSLYDQKFIDDATLRPAGGFIRLTDTDLETVQFTSISTDSIFGIDVTYIIPTDGNCFIIAKYDYYILGQEIINDVHLGLIADWDIPSDTLADNGSGYDEQLNTIWQYGAEYHDDNSGVCDIPETDRLGGISILQYAPLNVWTEDNQAHQAGSAFDPKFLYSQMATLTGYNPYSTGPTALIDLHTGITFDAIDMNPGEKYTYYYAMVTTNQGEADYLDQAAAAQNWAITHILPPSCRSGDANNDGQVNVGDAVYLISYIFKGGSPPTPYETCSGDANGDCQCNVGDAVYIISYVFKGGPAPVEFLDWYNACGPPQIR